MNWKLPVSLLIALMLALPAMAADWYVDPVAGNDVSGDGSVGNPWQTLTHTFSQTLGSDPAIHLAAGTFTTTLEGIDLNTAGTDWVVIPGSLGNVTIIGAGSSTSTGTVFDPSIAPITVPTWKHHYIFSSSGLTSLTLQDVALTNGRALLLASGFTGGVTVDNVTIATPDVESSSNLSPIHIHGAGGNVSLSNLTVSDTRSDADEGEVYGGGIALVHDVTGDISISNVNASGVSSPWYDGGAFCIDDITGAVSLSQVTISNSTAGNEGGAIYIGTVSGAVSLSTISLTNSSSTWGSGGGICVEDAASTIDLNTVAISGGHADQDGGAVYITNVRDNVTTDGLNITASDVVYASGGAVSIKTLLTSGIHIRMLNGIFDGNSSDQSNGGAVAVNGTSAASDSLTIDNFLVKNNSSGDWGEGGGVWVKDISVVSFTNSTIKANSNESAGSGYSGGGAYIENVESMVVDNVAFIENTSSGNGGGFAVYNQSNVNNDITVNQVLFLDNTTVGDKWTGDGGGFYVDDAGDVEVTYALFAGNYASGDGGAMYFDRFNNQSSLLVSSITMAYNEAGDDGDALFNSQNVEIIVENTIVWANGDTDRTVDPATLSTTDAIDGNLNSVDVSYSNIQTDGNLTGVTDDTTNTNIDPFFTDPTSNDYTVLPGSPMLDTGDPTTDPSAEPEPNNDIINVGYTPPTVVDTTTGEVVAATVGSVEEPVNVGDNTAASVAKTKAVRNKYMMIGAPVVPKADSLQSDPFYAWGDNLYDTKPSDGSYTWRFSRWMNLPEEAGGPFFGYVRFDETTDDNGRTIGDPPPIAPGYGYWFIYGDEIFPDPGSVLDSLSIDIQPDGMAAAGASPWVMTFDPKPHDSTGVPFGFNQLANPWPFEIDWQDVRFGTSETGPWVDPTTAASNGWVDAHAITWNNIGQTYVPKTGVLKAWEAFWVIVKIETPLYIQFNPVAPTVAAKRAGNMSPKFQAALSQNLNWSTLVSVRALNAPLSDMNTWIGVGSNLSDDYDTFDALDPSPQGYETLNNRTRLVDTTGTPVGTNSRLSRDFRKDDLDVAEYKAWAITPTYTLNENNPWGKTLPSSVPVRLSFPTISTVPSSIRLSLYAFTGYDFPWESATPLIENLAANPDTVLSLTAYYKAGTEESRYGYYWIVASDASQPLPSSNLLVDLGEEAGLPRQTQLAATYPNPFNPRISINYNMSHAGDARLVVFDILGREVAVLSQGHQPIGRYNVQWDATGQASGIYFIRFTAPEEKIQQTRKIIYQK